MADVSYASDATVRTNTTLLSDDMTLMGVDGADLPLVTDYSDIEAAVLSQADAEFLNKTNTSAYTPTADYHPATKKYVDDNGGGAPHYLLIRDVKSAGTAGGSNIAGTQTRDLTEITTDTGSMASLSSNQFTLSAGTYDLQISAPAYRINYHSISLYNVTDAVTEAVGSAEFNTSTTVSQSRSFLNCRITLTSSKTFEVRHTTTTAQTNLGLGIDQNFSGVSNVFTIVQATVY